MCMAVGVSPITYRKCAVSIGFAEEQKNSGPLKDPFAAL